MKTSDTGARFLAPFLGLSAAALLAAVVCAQAEPPKGGFALGQTKSGLICSARSDDGDHAAQFPHARAWAIQCLGWPERALGKLYAFPIDADRALNVNGNWRADLDTLAKDCGAPAPFNVAGLPNATLTTCAAVKGGKPYLVLQARVGDTAYVAQGPSALSGLFEIGLRVVAGLAPPPASALAVQQGAAGSDDVVATLDAAGPVQTTPKLLNDQAYIENEGWLFADAERDFRALAGNGELDRTKKAHAELNWALAVSNQGRVDEATALFKRAAEDAEAAGDGELHALVFNYQAMHACNLAVHDGDAKHYSDAIGLANQGIAARAVVRKTADVRASAEADSDTVVASPDDIVISRSVAVSLRSPDADRGFHVAEIRRDDRLRVQDAQAMYIVGSAELGLGKAPEARRALNAAQAKLTEGGQKRAGSWLQAQILGQLARLDLRQGDAKSARERAQRATEILGARDDLAASPSEASLYLVLAAAQGRLDQEKLALENYKTALQLFVQSRGALGPSADMIAPYLDLLITRSAARDSQSQYFDALQAVISPVTAQTVARLAARVGVGANDQATITARGLDDLQRQFVLLSGAIVRRQGSGDYPADKQAEDQQRLKELADGIETNRQKLLDENPNYGQLVTRTKSLDDLQQALLPHEVYYRNVLLAKAGYAIAVTHDSVRIFAFQVPRAKILAEVADLRLPFDTETSLPFFDADESHALFAQMFGPVQADVASAGHLIYDPDAALIKLPAGVFVTDQKSADLYTQRMALYRKAQFDIQHIYDDTAWLARKTNVSLVPSATAFLQARNFKPSAARNTFVGLGDPDFRGRAGDPNLFQTVAMRGGDVPIANCERARATMIRQLTVRSPYLGVVIDAIGRQLGSQPQDMVTGAAFTDVDLATHDLANYKIVFFGTHGLLPDDSACLPEPALVTSLGGGKSDGLLDATEILDLKLDAEIVVLAACNTGGSGSASDERTGLSGSGEALGGLARDFIYAGGRGLVVSQWNAEQRTTMYLMLETFKPAEVGQAEALRLAEDSLMDKPGFSHPYYWATFSFIGDGARPMPRAGR